MYTSIQSVRQIRFTNGNNTSPGARVVIACRDMRKAEAAAEDIRTDTGNKNVDIIKLDLACLKSVRECADYILKTEERIDILINNAGMFFRNQIFEFSVHKYSNVSKTNSIFSEKRV